MIKTLRHKFIAIAMGSMAAVLILLVGGMNLMNYRSILSDLDLRLDILADNNGRFPTDGLKTSDNELSDIPNMHEDFSADNRTLEKPDNSSFFSHNRLSEETPYDTRFFTVVLKNDGTVISVDTGKIAAVSTSEAGEYAQSLYSNGKYIGFWDSYRYRAIQVTGTNNEENTMYIFVNCERELNSFRSFLFSSIGVSILGMFLVFILVFYFSKLLVKPVAESYDKQKRFITDASHELKTPLTIIDANTEVIEMETGETEWTKSIHNQVKRLTSLTQKLVFLSRMDESNSNTMTMLDFSLSDAVLETAMPFVAVASTNNKSLSLNITPGLILHGDEALIRQLVSLLLDNAIKYSSAQGEITLTLKENGRSKILSILNPADNISAGSQDILFDRFYRADSSRNSSTGGFGIGLSVAKAIVLSHRGNISAKSDDGKSIIFTVTLP
ncbi:MAG: HAMP domain-containing histidine kinase [Lachnospiraceae bacterium]|nr:HAMP domain-containing histidine kinase [Lachnospiraceae bacterium]